MAFDMFGIGHPTWDEYSSGFIQFIVCLFNDSKQIVYALHPQLHVPVQNDRSLCKYLIFSPLTFRRYLLVSHHTRWALQSPDHNTEHVLDEFVFWFAWFFRINHNGTKLLGEVVNYFSHRKAFSFFIFACGFQRKYFIVFINWWQQLVVTKNVYPSIFYSL